MKKSELFDLYLQNKLREKELQEFKNQLNNDPEFNKEFQRLKEIRYAVRYNARVEIREQLDQIEAGIEKSRKPKRSTSIPVIIISLVAILSLAFVYIYVQKPTVSNLEVFNSYYKTLSIEDIIESPSITQGSLEGAALLAYQSGNFKLASQSFLEVASTSQKAEHYILGGLSAIEIGNYQIAVDQFNILYNQFPEYRSTALWYSGLSYLASDKKVEAASSFYSLSVEKESKYETTEILERLDILPSQSVSVGLIESIVFEKDSLSGNSYSPSYQKGIISDLTTRNSYEFFLIKPIETLKVGDMVNYLTLEEITEDNAIGIGVIDK